MVNLTAMRLLPSAAVDSAGPSGVAASAPVAAAQAPSTNPGPPTPGAHRRVDPPPATEQTVVRRRADAVRWRLAFDTGEQVLVEGLGLVGRRPEGRAGEAVRHLVALESQDMSLSKTHAQFHLAEDVLVVMDRGSTNGSVLIRQGVSRDLSGGKPATLLPGDRVRFGDREMTVLREG
ncbi:MAG: FHA domain-containing protein [Nocardioides sp.]